MYSCPSTYKVYPLRSMDVVPQVRLDIFELSVSVQTELSLIYTYTSPASPSLLIAPVNDEPSVRYKFSVDTSSTIISPSIS